MRIYPIAYVRTVVGHEGICGESEERQLLQIHMFLSTHNMRLRAAYRQSANAETQNAEEDASEFKSAAQEAIRRKGFVIIASADCLTPECDVYASFIKPAVHTIAVAARNRNVANAQSRTISDAD
jgi:hypothetical protein